MSGAEPAESPSCNGSPWAPSIVAASMRVLMKEIRALIDRAAWEIVPNLMERRSDNVVGIPLSKLFDSCGLAFIHVPKNAGTSIAFTLYGEQIPHFTAKQLYMLYRSRFAVWRKFAVIRDPIDRFISSTNYLLSGGINDHCRQVQKKIVSCYPDINDLATSFLDFRCNSLISDIHYRPQSEFVLGDENEILVDAILCYERVEEDMSRLLNVGMVFPHLNTTKMRFFERQDLTVESLQVLGHVYRGDFRMHEIAKRGISSVDIRCHAGN